MFEAEAIRALVMSILAGMSTMLGGLFIFKSRINEKMICIALGFAAGVMLSVSFLELWPLAGENLSRHLPEPWGEALSVGFVGVGMLLAGLIDRLVPEGINPDAESGRTGGAGLMRVGIISALAMGLHNFPEGAATFMAGYQDAGMGISIMTAIALHNIPEGISVAMPVYFATKSRSKAMWYTFVSGISEPVGALLAFLILKRFMNEFLLGSVFAVVAGIMIYIVVSEIIPASRNYGRHRTSDIAVFAGIILMALVSL